MINEENVLAVLGKPRGFYTLLKIVDPNSKSPDALDALLNRLLAAGKVRFNSRTREWIRT